MTCLKWCWICCVAKGCWGVGKACQGAGCHPRVPGCHLRRPETTQQGSGALQKGAGVTTGQLYRGDREQPANSPVCPLVDMNVWLITYICACQECSTWLNIAAAQEESSCALEDVERSYNSALRCAQESGQARLQVRDELVSCVEN